MNCAVSGGNKASINQVGEEEVIALQLEFQGICERGDYLLLPVRVGEYELWTVKYKNSPVSRMFDSLDKAIGEFLKLTGE
jgi:hypothetical protein